MWRRCVVQEEDNKLGHNTTQNSKAITTEIKASPAYQAFVRLYSSYQIPINNHNLSAVVRCWLWLQIIHLVVFEPFCGAFAHRLGSLSRWEKTSSPKS